MPTPDEIPELLEALDESYERRTITLVTSRIGPVPLDVHVQGITRIDHPNGVSSLVCSAADNPRGVAWVGSFARERYATPSGRARTRLARRGATVATIGTSSAHPGGLQAADTWLAVANEKGQPDPSIDIFDLKDPAHPAPYAHLPLQGAGGAGWVAMARRAHDDYLLFVGGPDFARGPSWAYGFQPSSRSFARLGTFTPGHNAPRSTLGDGAWGPQSGGSLFVSPTGIKYLITQGTKGDSGSDAYRERVRCFSLTNGGANVVLTQEPEAAPDNYVIDAEYHPEWAGSLFFASPGLRWGSTVFEDEHGELVMYVTERNPSPPVGKQLHELKIVEIRRRMP